MQHPRLCLAECEFEMLQYRNEAQLLANVLLRACDGSQEAWLEIAGLRLTVKTLDLFPPDVEQWRTRPAWDS